MMLLIGYLLLAIGVSFLCSLLEAVLLSVPRSHITVLIERGSSAGLRLRRMKDDIDQPLAAILTLNTFAHTLGAAGVGAQAAFLWGEAWVGAVSVVVTLLILFLSEIIPKTLGAVHAKSLAPFTAWVTSFLITALRPVVAVCNGISRLMSRRSQSMPRLSRDEVRSLAHIALEEGAIDEVESQILRNLIALRETRVRSIMTPRTVVATLGADQTVADVIRQGPSHFARIPIVQQSLDDARAVIHRIDLFKAVSEGKADARMSELARPLHAVPEAARLSDLIHEFIQRREHLFLVVDEYGAAVGIVTLEDAVESLLGFEIVDETDAVPDMQQLARRHLATKQGDPGRDPDDSQDNDSHA